MRCLPPTEVALKEKQRTMDKAGCVNSKLCCVRCAVALILTLLWMASSACPCSWDVYEEIRGCIRDGWGGGSEVTSPVVLCPGGGIFLVADPSDTDWRITANGGYPSTDTFLINNETSHAFTWTKTGGTWAGTDDEILHSQSVYWYAPNTPGTYTVKCVAKDDAIYPPGDKPDRDDKDDLELPLQMHVVAPDVDTDSNNDGTIDGADDGIEVDPPGRIIGYNDDDDNQNGISDRNDPASTNGENDLAEIKLAPVSEPPGYKLKLTSPDSGRIKAWRTADRTGQITISETGTSFTIGTDVPASLYVEGINSGPASLDLALLKPDGMPMCQDRIAFTVVEIDWVKITEVNGTAYPGGFTGSRIYVRAGGIAPTAPTLKLKAKVTPVIQGVTVNWQYEDPDEPSGNVPDDTDALADDNRGSGAGFPVTTSTTDVNGETDVVTFTATAYGGDDFILCARALNAHAGKTSKVAVWKKIAFEIEDALAGYTSVPTAVNGELSKVFVERVETAGTGDTIWTSDPYFVLGSGGAYGPAYGEDMDRLAGGYSDAPATDVQLVTVRAESPELNYIHAGSNKEPYNPGVFNYIFGRIGGHQIDWNDQGDMAPSENGAIGWYCDEPRFVIIYHDTCCADALQLDVSDADYLKRAVWHEVGHALGLAHYFADGYTSIMNQMPPYSSQADINLGRLRILNMHWSGGIDEEGEFVRRTYLPNAE